jgi:phosphatidylserine decarboxylase
MWEVGVAQVAMVQIASRLVRRIASFAREGQDVVLGRRIGVIRLESQVDFVVPVRDHLQVTVQPGERVTAGESIPVVLGPGTPQGAGRASRSKALRSRR